MDKEYLERLKKEDYIAWDSLVNDPQIVGVEDNNTGCLILFLVAIAAISFRVIYFN